MAYQRPWPIPSRDATTIHHITDSHVGYSDPYGTPRAWGDDKLRAVARDVHSAFVRNIDGMVHTGDITDDGGGTSGIEGTQDARAIDWFGQMDTGIPQVWCPGNHDFWDRDGDTGGHEPYTAAAWEYAYGRPVNGIQDMGDVRVLWFSPNKMERGVDLDWVITPNTLDWMDQQLSATSRPVVLATHYPLAELNLQNGFPTAGSHVKPSSQIDGLIDGHSNVAGLISGHRHHSKTDVRSVDVLTVGSRDIVHICGPSVSMTGGLDGYGGKASAPQWSLYLSITDPTRWEVRYRTHTPRRWDSVDGWRVTVANSADGTVTHTQGGTA